MVRDGDTGAYRLSERGHAEALLTDTFAAGSPHAPLDELPLIGGAWHTLTPEEAARAFLDLSHGEHSHVLIRFGAYVLAVRRRPMVCFEDADLYEVVVRGDFGRGSLYGLKFPTRTQWLTGSGDEILKLPAVIETEAAVTEFMLLYAACCELDSQGGRSTIQIVENLDSLAEALGDQAEREIHVERASKGGIDFEIKRSNQGDAVETGPTWEGEATVLHMHGLFRTEFQVWSGQERKVTFNGRLYLEDDRLRSAHFEGLLRCDAVPVIDSPRE